MRRVLGDSGATLVDLEGAVGRTVVAAELAAASGAGPLLIELVSSGDPTFRMGLGGRDEALVLMRRARPGQVLVGPTPAVVVGPGLPLGAELVGAGAERTYELRLAGPGAAASNLGWAHRAATGPFVGREQAMAELDAVWEATLRGRRRPVVVTGAAGIGSRPWPTRRSTRRWGPTPTGGRTSGCGPSGRRRCCSTSCATPPAPPATRRGWCSRPSARRRRRGGRSTGALPGAG